MEQIIAFVKANWAEIATAGLLLLRVVECIVKVTPTNVDNKILEVIKEFFRIS